MISQSLRRLEPFHDFDSLVFKLGSIIPFHIGKTYGDVVIDVGAYFFDSGSAKFSNVGMHDSECQEFGDVLNDLFCRVVDGAKRVVDFGFHDVKYT